MDWLLLRGLTRETAHWGDFPDKLAKAFPKDRIHTLDLPGTGSHCQENSPSTIAGIRQHLQARCHHLKSPFMLVGLSLGGMVALDWACAEPKRFAGVIVINSSSGLNPPWHRLQPRRWPTILKLLAGPNSDRREAAILALTSNKTQPDEKLENWQHLQRERPVTRQNAMRQMRAASRYVPPADAPTVPILLLASKGDRLVSAKCSRALSNHWTCELIEHDWAGHDLPLDDPSWTLERFMEFQQKRQTSE